MSEASKVYPKFSLKRINDYFLAEIRVRSME